VPPLDGIPGEHGAGERRTRPLVAHEWQHRNPDIALGLLAQISLGRIDRVGAETVLVLRDTRVLFLFDDLGARNTGEKKRNRENQQRERENEQEEM
jgi:hypothetical protein